MLAILKYLCIVGQIEARRLVSAYVFSPTLFLYNNRYHKNLLSANGLLPNLKGRSLLKCSRQLAEKKSEVSLRPLRFGDRREVSRRLIRFQRLERIRRRRVIEPANQGNTYIAKWIFKALSTDFTSLSPNLPRTDTIRVLSSVRIWSAFTLESLGRLPLPFGRKTSNG